MIRHAPDSWLALFLGALITLGFITFVSASFSILYQSESRFFSALGVQAVLGLGLGALGALIITLSPLKVLKLAALPTFAATLLLTLLVFVPGVGVEVNGATRWLSLFGVSVQPSELLKIGVVLAVAYVLQRVRPGAVKFQDTLLPALILGVVAIVLLAQPDTDSFIVMASGVFVILFIAGLPMRLIATLGAVLIVAAIVLVSARPYLLDRVQSFMNPERDPLGSGYQLQQSLIAIGSGGMFGKGFGQSEQKYSLLPEPTTDSVFAVYAEEFGFVGAAVLVVLYLLFAIRGYFVASRAADTFGAFVAAGIVTMIIVQALMNMMAMTGLFPLSGLPLPFVSRGGTALFAALLMSGMLLAVSRTMVRSVHV